MDGGTEGLSAEWIKASLDSYDKAVTNWNPPVINIGKGRNIVSELITAAIFNENPEMAAVRSSVSLNKLIESERELRK